MGNTEHAPGDAAMAATTENKAEEAQKKTEDKARARRSELQALLRTLDIEYHTNCAPALITVSVADLTMLLSCRDED